MPTMVMKGVQVMPITEINELKDRIVDQLSPLKVYLFGSFADGTNNEESDFDFYIVVDDAQNDLFSLTLQAYRAVRGIKKRPVDIVVGTQSRFEERKLHPTVESEVYHKGGLLYGA